MRQITKDIQINMDGNRIGFRLSKLDAFSGVMLLRLLMRLEDHQKCHPEQAAAQSKDLTMLDLIACLDVYNGADLRRAGSDFAAFDAQMEVE